MNLIKFILYSIYSTSSKTPLFHEGATSFPQQLTPITKGGKTEDGRVASPKSIANHLNMSDLKHVSSINYLLILYEG